MRSFLRPIAGPFAAMLLAGCAAMVSEQRGREVMSSPQSVMLVARNIFDAYHIPTAGSISDRAVQSESFDPAREWTQAQADERVECTAPAKPKKIDGPPTVWIAIRANAAEVRSSQRSPIARGAMGPEIMPVSNVYVTSSGRRSDGGHCKITDAFAETLLSAITSTAPSNRSATR